MIKSIGPERAQYITDHQPYPEAMREGVEVFARLLASGHCLGYFGEQLVDGKHVVRDDQLIGWILFEDESEPIGWDIMTTPGTVIKHVNLGHHRQVYCYDCAVLPECQRQGTGKLLAAAAYKNLRWNGYRIRMHCRRASYPSPGFLFRYGYEIVADVFLPDHYAKEYEDDSLKGEHAHELVLKPIGQ